MRFYSFIITIIVLLFFHSCNRAENRRNFAQKQPKILFDYETYNFNSILEGKTIDISFPFTNQGKLPLLLYDVRPSCGCTIINWPTNPILPNKTDTIKVKFNSSKTLGIQKKIITIFSNDSSYVKILTIKGEVKEKS